MPHFPIAENVEEALKHAHRSRRDDLGYLYHTFRIRLSEAKTDESIILSALVDVGWQLQGAPVVVEATGTLPRHVILSMLHAEPHPLQIRGEIRGELRGHSES